MPHVKPNTKSPKAADLLQELSVLALARTAMSSERSLMAWMRASVSLYSFGFSITKFMDYLEQQAAGTQHSGGLRNLGLVLIAMGILALGLAAAEHIKRIRTMKRLGLPTVSRLSLPACATLALLAIGMLTLFAIVLKTPAG